MRYVKPGEDSLEALEEMACGEGASGGVENDPNLEREFQDMEDRPEITASEGGAGIVKQCESGVVAALRTINRILMHQAGDPDIRRIRDRLSKAYDDLQENHPEIGEELTNGKD